MKYYFVRHGKTHWNLEGRLQGLTDVPLCDQGIVEARKLADWFTNLKSNQIITSPLTRGLTTAILISKKCNIPLKISNLCIERDLVNFEGMKFDLLENVHPEKLNINNLTRSWDWCEYIEKDYFIQKKVKYLLNSIKEYSNPIIVTHAGVIHSMVDYFFKTTKSVDIHIPTGSIVIIDTDKNKFEQIIPK